MCGSVCVYVCVCVCVREREGISFYKIRCKITAVSVGATVKSRNEKYILNIYSMYKMV